MATLKELIDSRESAMDRDPEGEPRLKQITLHYILEGTSSDETARDLVVRSTSTTYDELVRSDIRLEPQVVDTVEGTGTWSVEVDYVREEKIEPQVGDSSYFFDTTGGTQHVTQSLETIYSDGPGPWKAPDCQGAICVKGHGAERTVEGVDIVMPVYSWTETHYIPDSKMTPAYKGKLFHLTAKMNDKPWRGLEAGEALFRGATGSKTEPEKWEVTFGFSASENKTNWLPASLPSGDLGFKPFDKKGWDFLWFLYEPKEDTGSKRLVPGPVGIYVERLYQEGDLSNLGI